MTAAAAVRRAYDEGVHITCDGDKLVLRASNPPAAEVIDLLKQHKADIISLLATQSVGQDAGRFSERSIVRPIVPDYQESGRSNAISAPVVDRLPLGESVHLSHSSSLTLGKSDFSNFSTLHTPAGFPSEGAEGGEGGETGAAVVWGVDESEAALRAKESDPNPNLPWPLPGETLLPGWGTRVSMEYRLRNASEDECLDWAKEPWQLELVAKARGYPQLWVDQILLNRAMWKKAFAARHEGRALNLDLPIWE